MSGKFGSATCFCAGLVLGCFASFSHSAEFAYGEKCNNLKGVSKGKRGEMSPSSGCVHLALNDSPPATQRGVGAPDSTLQGVNGYGDQEAYPYAYVHELPRSHDGYVYPNSQGIAYAPPSGEEEMEDYYPPPHYYVPPSGVYDNVPREEVEDYYLPPHYYVPPPLVSARKLNRLSPIKDYNVKNSSSDYDGYSDTESLDMLLPF